MSHTRKLKIFGLVLFFILAGQMILPISTYADTTDNKTTQSAPCPPPENYSGDIKEICQGYDCYNQALSGNKDAQQCWSDYGLFSGDPKRNPVSPACLACGLCDVCDLASGVSGIMYWIYFFISVTILAVVIWGGAQYLFSGGNPARAKKGLDILKYTGLSLIIIFLAYTIVAYILYLLTQGKSTPAGSPPLSGNFLTAWLAPCQTRQNRLQLTPHLKAIDEKIACYKYPLVNTQGVLLNFYIYKFCPPPIGQSGTGGCGFTTNILNQEVCYTFKDAAGQEQKTCTPGVSK